MFTRIELGLGATMIVTLAILGACAQGDQGPTERLLVVGPVPLACPGSPPQTCLQVSESGGNRWTMAYDEVQGFAYQPGFSYEILVEEQSLTRQASSMTILHPTLVKVVSQQSVGVDDVPGVNGIGGGSWQLQNVEPSEHDAAVWSASQITAEFHGDDWVGGFSGCNRYFAGVTVDGVGLGIAPPAATGEACASPAEVMALERAYLTALTKVSSFALDGDRLELLLAGGGKIRFGAAPG